MERKKFLQLTATSLGGLLVLPEFLHAQALCRNKKSKDSDDLLVFIQLNGGNDGLNTFIPYQDPLYYEYRPSIGIPKADVINKINGMGFHPAMKDFAKMAQDGNLTIIQNVGYPNPNRSHFRSQEIWQTASSSNEFLLYGWLGRYLDIHHKDHLIPSLNVDGTDNLALKTTQANNITMNSFSNLRNFTATDFEQKLSDNPQLDFVRRIQYASIQGMGEIQKALANSKENNEFYTRGNSLLSRNLQWISRLIKGNLESKIYYTSFSGFDTHSSQLGRHQNQLTILNDAVYSFYSDLKHNNLLDRVTIVIFTEFGRRVRESGGGTDHGAATPMFIIGGKNKGAVIGKNPNLQNLERGDIIYDIDFRSVYAMLLDEKMKFDPQKINISNNPLKGVF